MYEEDILNSQPEDFGEYKWDKPESNRPLTDPKEPETKRPLPTPELADSNARPIAARISTYYVC
jgi:hypothetical protein